MVLVCIRFLSSDLVYPYTDANHDPPEIHKIVPAYGSCQGREQVVIVGTRMHSGEIPINV